MYAVELECRNQYREKVRLTSAYALIGSDFISTHKDKSDNLNKEKE